MTEIELSGPQWTDIDQNGLKLIEMGINAMLMWLNKSITIITAMF